MQSSFREILLLYDIIYLIHKELSVVHSVCFIPPIKSGVFSLPVEEIQLDIIYLIYKELSVVHSVCFIPPRLNRGFFLF